MKHPTLDYLSGVFDCNGLCHFDIQREKYVSASLQLNSTEWELPNSFGRIFGGNVSEIRHGIWRWQVSGELADTVATRLLAHGALRVARTWLSTWVDARTATGGLTGPDAVRTRYEWSNKVREAKPSNRGASK